MKFIPGFKFVVKKRVIPTLELNKTYMVHHILPLTDGKIKYNFVCEGKLIEQEFESLSTAESLIEKMKG